MKIRKFYNFREIHNKGWENLSLLNIITQLIKEKGYTIAKIEKELDFGNGAIRRWDTSSPSCDKLVKLADFLNVSVDYLLGRTDIKEKALPEKEEPNAATKRLMELYNELNREGQEKLLDYADDLVTSGKYKKDSKIQLDNEAV